MSKIICYTPHVNVDVPLDKWVCPNCGCGYDNAGGWFIDEGAGHDDCELLHNDDYLKCEKCSFDMNGKQYSAWYSKKVNAVKCPCCNGNGVVSKKKANDFKQLRKGKK